MSAVTADRPFERMTIAPPVQSGRSGTFNTKDSRPIPDSSIGGVISSESVCTVASNPYAEMFSGLMFVVNPLPIRVTGTLLPDGNKLLL